LIVPRLSKSALKSVIGRDIVKMLGSKYSVYHISHTKAMYLLDTKLSAWQESQEMKYTVHPVIVNANGATVDLIYDRFVNEKGSQSCC